jgi:hypothetical protein
MIKPCNSFLGDASCRLMYASTSIAMQPISPSQLFSGVAHANGSPFELFVSSSVLCSSSSAISFQPQFISIWTAGSTIFMTVTARDMYGNGKTNPDSVAASIYVRSQALDRQGVSMPGTTQSRQFPLSFTINLSPIVSGLTLIDASFVLPSTAGRGMHATYYR